MAFPVRKFVDISNKAVRATWPGLAIHACSRGTYRPKASRAPSTLLAVVLLVLLLGRWWWWRWYGDGGGAAAGCWRWRWLVLLPNAVAGWRRRQLQARREQQRHAPAVYTPVTSAFLVCKTTAGPTAIRQAPGRPMEVVLVCCWALAVASFASSRMAHSTPQATQQAARADQVAAVQMVTAGDTVRLLPNIQLHQQ
jgi:hypothetical protein